MSKTSRGDIRLMIPTCTLLIALAASSATAQPEIGSIGIQASLQDNQGEIGLPYWASSDLVVEPFLSVAHVSDAGTDIGAGLMLRFLLGEGPAVPYFGVRAGVLYFSPESGDGTTDIVLGPAVGGEYFLSPDFSLGVEAQLNIALSDEFSGRFGNPDGTTVNTATAVSATFYF